MEKEPQKEKEKGTGTGTEREKDKDKERQKEQGGEQLPHQKEHDEEGAAPDGSTVDIVYQSYKACRSGLLEAFNSGLSMLLKEGKQITKSTPYLERKVLWGLPDGEWILLPVQYHNFKQPPEPQPLLPFDKDVHWHEWVSRMADFSDGWLIALSYYQSRLFNPQERLDLIDKISRLPSIKDEITPECPVENRQSDASVFNREYVSRRGGACSCLRRRCSFVAGGTVRDQWVQCDSCHLWYHCSCCGLSFDEAEKLQSYHCDKCSIE